MKGTCEVWLLALCLLVQRAPGQTWNGAARDLARKVAAVASREPAPFTIRNQSGLPAREFAQARAAVESELRAHGVNLVENSSNPEIRITVSENFRAFLFVAEVQRAGERLVLMSDWPRPGSQAAARPALTLDRRLLREQDDPILDCALLPNGKLLLVLEPERLAVYAAGPAGWEPQRAFPIAVLSPRPRDLRGRLAVQGPTFQAYVPGTACRGTVEPLAIECSAGDVLWPLVSGATSAGYAAFQPARNDFEGVITTASGARATVPPFYSMALAGDTAEPLWIFTSPSGRASLYTSSLAPSGQHIPGWGTDIAGLEAGCGAGRQVLATKPGDISETDAVQAYEISGGQAVPVGSALEFPGPVTALWPSGAAAATAVVRDPKTGHYAAYTLAIGCGS